MPFHFEQQLMKSTPKQQKPVTAEAIARLADAGKNVSPHFTDKGRRMQPIQWKNVDFVSSRSAACHLDPGIGILRMRRGRIRSA
jgi:hypothetical protein